MDVDTSELEMFSTHVAVNNGAKGTMPTTTVNPPYWEIPLNEAMESNSLIDVRPSKLVLSSIKKTEERESIIVRLFNPYNEPVEEAQVYVSALLNVKKAYRCRLDEKREEELDLRTAKGQGQYISLSVPRKKIVTLEFI